jgi:hypothetical protein
MWDRVMANWPASCAIAWRLDLVGQMGDHIRAELAGEMGDHVRAGARRPDERSHPG